MSWYKESNALAQSLGLQGGSLLFKEVQKYEQKMKADQNWQKIKNIKKRDGRDAAIDYLNKILNGYRQDDTVGTVRHMERTPTGGDWYFYSNGIKGRRSEFDAIGKDNWYESPRYDELYDQHYESVKSEYKEFVENILDEKIDEVVTMKERLNEDREVLGEEEFTHKLAGYDIEEDKYESMQRELPTVGLDELQEMLEKLGHDEEDLTARVSDSVYEEIMEERDALEKEFEKEKKELLSLTCGGHWCVSQPKDEEDPHDGGLESHLKDGKDFMVLRRGGNPRIAISFNEEANDIYEVQAIGNEIDNLSTLDLLDLEHVPIWGLDEIIDYLEGQEGDDFINLLRMRFFDLQDEVIQSNPDIKKTVDRALDDIMAVVAKEAMEANNPPENVLNYIDEAREGGGNAYIIDVVTNYFAEYFKNISKHDVDVDLVFNIVDAYSLHYADLMQKLFNRLHPVALKNYFDWVVGAGYEINEEILEALQAVFGQEIINKYIEDIKHPYYNLTEQDVDNIMAFILKGDYRDIDVNQFIRDDREFSRLRNMIFAQRVVIELSSEGVALLNNFHEMSRQLQQYYYDSPTVDIADKIFFRIKASQGANNFQGIVNAVDLLKRMGLNQHLISHIANKPEYKVALIRTKEMAQNQPNLVEGLPLAPNNTETPQMLPPVQTSRNWYNNGKFICSSNKQLEQGRD